MTKFLGALNKNSSNMPRLTIKTRREIVRLSSSLPAMSARLERAETIEVDTEEWRIIQCRGKHNQDSQYHEAIMEAMTNNINKYRRMAL